LGVAGYDCVMPDQVDWFIQESNSIGSTDPDKSKGIAFFHIPLVEHMQLHNDYETYGTKGDNVGCSSVNTGFFSAIKEAGTISWVTTGHDHNNDYYGDYEGVMIGYGRKTGYGCYGPKNMLRGARVFDLTYEPFTIDTWVRQEDGTQHIETTVNQPTKAPWTNHAFCSYSETRNE
jgi:hypothetical protein